MYRRESRSVWLALGLALVGHVFFVLCFYFAALTLQDPDDVPSLVGHFMTVPIGMAIQAGIPLPGGIGGGEYVFGKLYQLIDYPEANGVLMSLVYRSVTWILGLIGYIVYLQMRPSLKETPATADTDSEAAACALCSKRQQSWSPGFSRLKPVLQQVSQNARGYFAWVAELARFLHQP